jgi:hypothetical protein
VPETSRLTGTSLHSQWKQAVGALTHKFPLPTGMSAPRTAGKRSLFISAVCQKLRLRAWGKERVRQLPWLQSAHPSPSVPFAPPPSSHHPLPHQLPIRTTRLPLQHFPS